MRKVIIILAAILAPVFSYAAYTGGVLGGALIVPTWYAPDATPYVTISSHTRVSDGGSNYVDIDPIVGFIGPGAGLTDLDWAELGNFPASCAPQCVVSIGTTLTCGDCSGGGGSGGGNAYTESGVVGQIPVYIAVDSITASGLIPSQVRTTTTALTSADVDSTIRITSVAITGADVNSDILLSTNPYVAKTTQENSFINKQRIDVSGELFSLALSNGLVIDPPGNRAALLASSYGGDLGFGASVIGVYAVANSSAGTNATIGIRGFADAAAGPAYGVLGVATGANINYGVYGSASGGTNNYAGYFNGNVVSTGAFISPAGVFNTVIASPTTSGGFSVWPTYDPSTSGGAHALDFYHRNGGVLSFVRSGYDTDATDYTRYTDMGIGTTQAGSKLRFITANTEVGQFDGNGILRVSSSVYTYGGSTNGMRALSGTRFGYSASYPVLRIGSTFAEGFGTVSIGYDPINNTNNAFSGDGREVLFRNGVQFVTPNSADNAFYLYHIVLKDGKVGINTASPTVQLEEACPSGFTNIKAGDNQLGCMQTARSAGTATYWDANDYCFDNYGGRLPLLSEFYVSANNFTLTDATGQWQWIADYSGPECARVGLSSITGADYAASCTGENYYRCWIPK